MSIMRVQGYTKAVEALAELIGDEIGVNDGAETWALWCLVDALHEAGPETPEMATRDFQITTIGIYAVCPDGMMQSPPVVRVIEP